MFFFQMITSVLIWRVHKEGGTPFVVKYAFKREEENPEYSQKQWFEEDSSKFFPVFFVERKYYKDILQAVILGRKRKNFTVSLVLILARRRSNGIFPNKRLKHRKPIGFVKLGRQGY